MDLEIILACCVPITILIIVIVLSIRDKSDKNKFEEFPSDPELDNFDPSDRKFIAVSLATSDRPPIIVAVDRGWTRFHEPLVKNGIKIQFLCPDVVTPS
jgi:hypothetical protein